MTQRHPVQSEATILATTVTKDRKPIFMNPAAARIAIETLYEIQTHYGFFLFGFVIMPDHAHILLWPPEGNSLSKILQIWKRAVTFNIGRGPLWQRRFDARSIDDPAHALKYIHNNPVVAGMVDCPENYPWSSASGRWDISPLDAIR